MGHGDFTRRTLLKGVAAGGAVVVADGALADRNASGVERRSRVGATSTHGVDADVCTRDWNHLLLEGHGGGGTDYWIRVTDEIVPGEYEDPELREQGGLGSSWVDWSVVDYYDDYYYSGRVIDFVASDPQNVTLYHNGSEIDRADLVSPGDVSHILLEGHGGGTDYRIEVTGGIAPAQYEDPELQSQGGIGYDWVDWSIVDYYDDYYYTGEITTFDVGEPENVTVYHDCLRTTPETLVTG